MARLRERVTQSLVEQILHLVPLSRQHPYVTFRRARVRNIRCEL